MYFNFYVHFDDHNLCRFCRACVCRMLHCNIMFRQLCFVLFRGGRAGVLFERVLILLFPPVALAISLSLLVLAVCRTPG